MPSPRQLQAFRRPRGATPTLALVRPAIGRGGAGERLSLATSEGEAWEIALTPSFYRGLVEPAPEAGPTPLGEVAPPPPSPWAPGSPHAVMASSASGADDDGLVLSRLAVAAFLERERPTEMARALDLAEEERRDPRTAAASPVDRAAAFESRWEADAVASRLGAVLSHAPDRVRRDPGARDVVTFWVRRDDVGAVQGRSLAASPLVRAVDQPEWRRADGADAGPELGAPGPSRAAAPPAASPGPGRDVPTGSTLQGAEGLQHLHDTFGLASERRVHLDVGKLRAELLALPPAQREAALLLLERVAAGSSSIARHRERPVLAALAAAVAPSRGGYEL